MQGATGSADRRAASAPTTASDSEKFGTQRQRWATSVRGLLPMFHPFVGP